MFCIKCGKEIPENSIYCPFCGKHQQNEKFGFHYSQKIRKYKVLLLVYLVWCLIHISLFLFSKPTGTYNVGSQFLSGFEERHYDHSGGFYPFDVSLTDVIKGNRYWLNLIDNIDVYDITELFFYTLLLPSIVLLFVLLWKKCISKYKTSTNYPERNFLSLNHNNLNISSFGKKCIGYIKGILSPKNKSKLILGIVFIIACIIYYYPKGSDQSQDDLNNNNELKSKNKHTSTYSTGDVPYFGYYGYTLSCDDCSGVQVTAPDNSDVIVIVKKDNEQGKVVGNVYISAGDTYKIGLREDGLYQTFFYMGNGWNPHKDMGNGIKGGFERDEHFSKDDPQNIQNSVLSYVLQLQSNGNFNAKNSERSDIFN